MSKKYVGNIGTNKILNVIFNGLKGKEDNMNEITYQETLNMWNNINDKEDITNKYTMSFTSIKDGSELIYNYTDIQINGISFDDIYNVTCSKDDSVKAILHVNKAMMLEGKYAELFGSDEWRMKIEIKYTDPSTSGYYQNTIKSFLITRETSLSNGDFIIEFIVPELVDPSNNIRFSTEFISRYDPFVPTN